jgi:hypothetical protein
MALFRKYQKQETIFGFHISFKSDSSSSDTFQCVGLSQRLSHRLQLFVPHPQLLRVDVVLPHVGVVSRIILGDHTEATQSRWVSSRKLVSIRLLTDLAVDTLDFSAQLKFVPTIFFLSQKNRIHDAFDFGFAIQSSHTTLLAILLPVISQAIA